MNINKNIWNKIVDIMALNKWKKQIKNVNTIFSQIFVYSDQWNYLEGRTHDDSRLNDDDIVVCRECLMAYYSDGWGVPNYRNNDVHPILGMEIASFILAKCELCHINYGFMWDIKNRYLRQQGKKERIYVKNL